MAGWQDNTFQVETAPSVDVAPDGRIHVTWHEEGASLTVILTREEAEGLTARIAAALSAPVGVIAGLVGAL